MFPTFDGDDTMYVSVIMSGSPEDKHGRTIFIDEVARMFPKLYCPNSAHAGIGRPIYELFDVERTDWLVGVPSPDPDPPAIRTVSDNEDQNMLWFLQDADRWARKNAHDAKLAGGALRAIRSAYSIPGEVSFFRQPRISTVKLKSRPALLEFDIIALAGDQTLLSRPEVAQRYPEIRTVPAWIEDRRTKSLQEWREWVVLEQGHWCEEDGDPSLRPCSLCGEPAAEGARKLIRSQGPHRLFRCHGGLGLIFEAEFFREITMDFATNFQDCGLVTKCADGYSP